MGIHKVILIEDDDDWLHYLIKILEDNFNVDIEKYKSFKDGEERILKKPIDYDLLITDIFPEDSRIIKGLDFAEFVLKINHIPVIVVTGDLEWMKIALKKYEIIDAFHKENFNILQFILSVSSIINSRNNDKVNNLIEELPQKISKEIFLYQNEIMGKLNLIINNIDTLVNDQEIIYSELITNLNIIKDSNSLIQEFLSEIESESSKDKKTIEHKLKLTITIIPFILKLESSWDLGRALEELPKFYDSFSLKAYQKITRIYYSWLTKL